VVEVVEEVVEGNGEEESSSAEAKNDVKKEREIVMRCRKAK